MGRKEIWVEGSFAGEMKVEERPSSAFGEDGLTEAFDEGEWDADADEEEWFDGETELWDASSKCKGRGSRNVEIGRRGEDAAARYLERLGYDILERNYECPFGEADIIARDGLSLVFVEVKTRTGVSRGFPSEAVDEEKRGRYERIAGWYLGSFRETGIPVRFDIVAIMVIAKDRAFLRHYRNAFSVGL